MMILSHRIHSRHQFGLLSERERKLSACSVECPAAAAESGQACCCAGRASERASERALVRRRRTHRACAAHEPPQHRASRSRPTSTRTTLVRVSLSPVCDAMRFMTRDETITRLSAAIARRAESPPTPRHATPRHAQMRETPPSSLSPRFPKSNTTQKRIRSGWFQFTSALGSFDRR